jgi:hypothetical protein
MTRTLRILFVALVPAVTLIAGTVAGQTPPLPTLDQILDKYVASVGGRAAIEKITTVTARGTIEIPAMTLTGTVELLQKAPDKVLTRTDIAGMGVQREGFDGTNAWSEDGQMGLRDRTGAEFAEAKRTAMFPRELKLKAMYPKMTVKSREKLATGEAYLIEGASAEGTPIRMYFDTESGLLVRQIVQRQSPQGPLELNVTFEDFRVVDGVKRPFAIRQETSFFSAVVKYTDVKHNLPIDDATFSKPK